MSKIRIVHDNAASRATLAASTEAGALLASNLLKDDTDSVWRATGTTATITLTWPSLEPVSCVFLPFCNLSPTATIRVRGYSDAAGTTQVFDTAAQLACPAPAVVLRGWTAAQSASAYAYGGGAYARIWFNQASVRRLVIDIADASNLQGYIEAACLVAGPHWEPKYNATGASIAWVDSTEIYRTDAGTQGATAGTVYRRLPVSMAYMTPADRVTFVNLCRNSRAYPMLVSLYHGTGDASLERDGMIYGRRAKDLEVTAQYAAAYSTAIELEEL
jgi:hypothetical protein